MRAWPENEAKIALGPGALGIIQQSDALNPKFRGHLRLVEIADAPFIHSLRTDPNLNRYLSPVPPDIASQEAWISDYKKRQDNGEEFYFVICCDGCAAGLVRVHEFRYIDGLRSMGWASLVMQRRPPGLVTFSAMLIHELGLEVLGFEQSYFETLSDNPLVSFLTRMGAKREGEHGGQIMFTFGREAFREFKRTDRWRMAKYRQPGCR